MPVIEDKTHINKKKILLIGLAVFTSFVLIVAVVVILNNRVKTVPEDVTTSLEEASCSDEQLAKLLSIVESNKPADASEQKAAVYKALADCYVLRGELTEATETMKATAFEYEQAGLEEQKTSAEETANSLQQASESPENPPETPEGIPDVEDEGTFAN